MRIVSLLPAATEIVAALGLRSQLVGRSHECDYPLDVAELPALTRARLDSSRSSGAIDAEVKRVLAAGLPLYELDEAQLASLQPDLVVTQEACEVCAVSYEQVECTLARLPVQARIVSLKPAFLGDILRDVRIVADACEISEVGEELARGLAARLERLDQSRPPGPRPRIAVVEWLSPPMLAGHWTPELIEAAGGEPVGAAAGGPSPYASFDEIAALQPDVVVVAACGMDLDRTRREAEPHRERLRALAPRVLLFDGNAYVNRPGPRVVDAAETLAAFLRGESVPAERGCRL